jgi:hypothetical protein
MRERNILTGMFPVRENELLDGFSKGRAFAGVQ